MLRRMKRRHFLVLSAASVGGVLVYSLDRQVSRLSAQDNKSLKIPLRYFTEDEALIVAAAAARIMPSDDSGPGAREAGVVIYIDRQLAGPWGRDGHRYTHEPFDEKAGAEFGYQGGAPPAQIYREGLKQLAGFNDLTPLSRTPSSNPSSRGASSRCCARTPSRACSAIRSMAETRIWSDGR